MPEAQPPAQPAFPLTQRELVGLAMQPGCRKPVPAPAAPTSQRELVRQSLERGLGGTRKARPSGARTGIYR